MQRAAYEGRRGVGKDGKVQQACLPIFLLIFPHSFPDTPSPNELTSQIPILHPALQGFLSGEHSPKRQQGENSPRAH